VSDFEVLEHTADVGLIARGSTREDLFRSATEGMAKIAGVLRPGRGEAVPVRVEAPDVEALLVDWLNEVLYVHDSRGVALRRVTVERVTEEEVTGRLEVEPLGAEDDEGVQIKAVTMHQLYVREVREGWEARVFFDV
jgi:SHS2 domain-containing protein